MKRNGIAQKKWTKINVQFSFPQNSFVKRPQKTGCYHYAVNLYFLQNFLLL